MPVPKANQKAVNKYVKANYDRINVTMPKGKKETIQAAAAAAGESVNAYINGAIDARMCGKTRKIPQEPAGAILGEGVAASLLPSDTIKVAQEAAEAAGEAVPVFIARAVETQAQRDEAGRKLKGGQ